MTGYVRKDTTNNIADGNVINAADLDSEFDGVQAAFNSSTGHTHDGSSAEGAPITKLGPVQDVTISTTVLGVKTTNTVDLGTSSLKFKDFYLAGNASIGGTLGVTSTATFTGAVIFNGNTTIGDADTDTITQAASYVTGTQLKSAKTATNTLSLAAYDVDGTAYTNLITLTASNTPTLALTSTGVGTINNMSIGATTASTGAFTTLSASGAVTLSGGTINGVAYLNGTNVLTTGSALVFDGTNLGLGGTNNSYGSQTTMTLSGTNVSRIDFRSNSTFTGTILSYQAVTEGLRLQTEAGYPITFYPAGTKAATIDTAGNLGLGVTPSANAGQKTLSIANQTGSFAALTMGSNFTQAGYIGYNMGNTGTNSTWKYISADNGSALWFNGNEFRFMQFASGSAGATTTGTQAMTLDASGRLMVGVTSNINSSSVIQAGGINNARIGIDSPDSQGFYFTKSSANNGTYRVDTNGNFEWYTKNVSQAMILDVSGNLLVGQTSKTTGAQSTAKLGVSSGITLTNGSYGGFMEGVNTSGTTYGYLSLGSAYNAFSAGDVGLGTSGALPLLFATNNIERARFNSTGALVFAGGTTSANGVGITFPATQSASSNVNTLDDYEEGTFTPTCTLTTPGTSSTASAVGFYTKVGNLVTVVGRFTFTKGTGSGDLVLGGLPFTSLNTFAYQSSGALTTDSFGVAGKIYYIILALNTTAPTLFAITQAGGAAVLASASDFGAGAIALRYTFSYQTD